MSLLLTESCDIGLFRWSVNGLVSSTENGGAGKFGSFVIDSSENNFDNYISQQFREPSSPDNIRSVRLSFWIKATGEVNEDSNFIKIDSVRQNVGAILGINKKGQFYSGYITKNSEWQGKVAEENISQPNVADGYYHYVEVDALWDNSSTSYIRIYVDNALYINIYTNTSYESACWDHPSRITFGNLNGASLEIDDIVVWDDLGSSYIGYKGSTKLRTTKAISVEEYTKKNANKSFNIENNGSVIGGMLTARVNSEEGKSSSVEIYAKIGNNEQTSKEHTVLSSTPKTIKLPIDTANEDTSKFTVGYKRTK